MNTPALAPLTDATEVILNSYFAVQLKLREDPAKVVETVCLRARSMGILFRRIERLDTFTLGTRSFLRLRSDLSRSKEVLLALATAEGRGVVYPTADSKFETFVAGRTVPFSAAIMHLVPRGSVQMFRGPKVKNWTRQFPGLE